MSLRRRCPLRFRRLLLADARPVCVAGVRSASTGSYSLTLGQSLLLRAGGALATCLLARLAVSPGRPYPLPVAAKRRRWRAACEEVEMRTYSPKASEIQRAWHVIDADGLVLGRLATEAARVLRGKHKPVFAPHLDTGDHVVIVNASKVVLTSAKAEGKGVYRHSGYPGGIKRESYADLLARRPGEAVRRSIKGMLPKGPLGRQMLKKLRVYAGPEHPHHAQQPEALELAHAKAR
jgi:large subunit ribosomal protein L13